MRILAFLLYFILKLKRLLVSLPWQNLIFTIFLILKAEIKKKDTFIITIKNWSAKNKNKNKQYNPNILVMSGNIRVTKIYTCITLTKRIKNKFIIYALPRVTWACVEHNLFYVQSQPFPGFKSTHATTHSHTWNLNEGRPGPSNLK